MAIVDMAAEEEAVLEASDLILERVRGELSLQMDKWGVQGHRQGMWYAILGEEFGEVGKAICEFGLAGRGEFGLSNLRDELVQVAAVAVAMAESLGRCGFGGAA